MYRRFSHVFVVPAGGGTPRQLTSDDYNHGRDGLSWTPNSEEILFSSLRVPEWEYEWRECTSKM